MDLKKDGFGEHHVPLVDLSLGDKTASDLLMKALTTVGFACLTNTGCSLWTTAEEYAIGAKEFFQLPLEQKNAYRKPIAVMDNGGYVAVGREQLSSTRPADYKECFNMMRYIKGDKQRCPSLLDNEKCWSLWDSFEKLADRILYLIGLGLDLDDARFLCKTHDFTDPIANRSAQRVNFYPKVNQEVVPGQIRCGEHSDYGSITLLYSSAPGLQIVNRSTGEYLDAGYVEGGIFVNIGDLLQMWSADVLIANKHRVLIPEEKYLQQDRVSIAFFCQPNNDQVIETLDGSGKYPPVTAGGWLASRFEATYDTK